MIVNSLASQVATTNRHRFRLHTVAVCLLVAISIHSIGPRLVLANADLQTSTLDPAPAQNSVSLRPFVINSTAKPIVGTSLLSTTTPTSLYINNTSQQAQSQSAKYLKFTLIAGKLWKFNIKSNSFPFNNRAGELRLHKNVSSNSYIIDDDSWFQYNSQQQQLFAWPSVSTKIGTYYFVLLPSGIDYEAGNENSINLDIVANIVVELIRPIYANGRADLDQLLDHKFSLEHLHRHLSYPLLLQQIISVFESITKSSENGPTPLQVANHTTSTTTSTTTTSSPTSLTTQSLLTSLTKGSKNTNKFGEFLLISSTYSADGELFSIVWSTNSALSNNTVAQIGECRLATINNTVAKLSSLSSGYQSDDKYVIYYPLDVSASNRNAIVPTERGNFALKLVLNEPCQRDSIIDDLVVTASRKLIGESIDKENDIVDLKPPNIVTTTVSGETTTVATTPVSITVARAISLSPNISNTDAIDSNTASKETTNKVSTPSQFKDTETTSSTTTSQAPIASTEQENLMNLVATAANTSSKFFSTASEQTAKELTEIINETTTVESKIVDPILKLDNSKNNIEARVSKTDITPTQHHPSTHQKAQPQAKSFVNFLESSDAQSANNTTMSASNDSQSSTTPQITTGLSLSVEQIVAAVRNATIHANNDSTINVVPSHDPKSASQTSLNEDFIGILNDVMEYLISVAVPLSVIVGIVLLVSIIVALFNLCLKKRKSKQFQVRDRFNLRYGSERRAFLKNGSKPVILEADQKSISMGPTPQHGPSHQKRSGNVDTSNYVPMNMFSSSNPVDTFVTPEHERSSPSSQHIDKTH